MDAKEYLEQIGKLTRKISAMKLRSEEYERLSMSVPGQDFTRPRVDHTPSNDAYFVKWLLKKDEIDREIEKLEKKLQELKAEVLLKIESLENEDYKNIIIMRYFGTLTWEEIANKMFYSIATIKRWHKKALEKIT